MVSDEGGSRVFGFVLRHSRRYRVSELAGADHASMVYNRFDL
jgi:hypothetical protein